jgi:glycolate oxidase iron-sulfur subunit
MDGPGVFDPIHPPSAERIRDCVHCGWCLPACPTYQLWGEEMDSPRGRIYLMKLGREGEIAMDPTFVRHIDACLGCMACVTVCPSGVRYGELIEATRAQIERNHPRARSDRAFRSFVFWLFPHRGRLRVAALLGWAYRRLRLDRLVRRLGLLARLPARLRALESLLPETRLGALGRRLPEHVPARGERRLTVGLLTGCVQSVFFSETNAATARVLAAEGCDVVIPRDQPCCGALMLHAGRDEQARARARRLIAAFEDSDLDRLVVTAAGCGSTLKEYDKLLADDPDWAERAEGFAAKVRDVTEVLARLEPRAPRRPLAARVAYHDACHLLHAQRVRDEPRRVLAGIPGVELVEAAEPALCCGSAGIYNLLEPDAAEELGRRKAANLAAAEPDVVATANPGCLLQIRRSWPDSDGADVPIVHPVELVDASIRGLGPAALRGAR